MKYICIYSYVWFLMWCVGTYYCICKIVWSHIHVWMYMCVCICCICHICVLLDILGICIVCIVHLYICCAIGSLDVVVLYGFVHVYMSIWVVVSLLFIYIYMYICFFWVEIYSFCIVDYMLLLCLVGCVSYLIYIYV